MLITMTSESSTISEKSIVKHMPKVGRTEQPTVALITSLYVEKLAIDAMIENKETFIRYKTDGKSIFLTFSYEGQLLTIFCCQGNRISIRWAISVLTEWLRRNFPPSGSIALLLEASLLVFWVRMKFEIL